MEVAAAQSLSSAVPSFFHGSSKTSTFSCSYQSINRCSLRKSHCPEHLNCARLGFKVRQSHSHSRKAGLVPVSVSVSASASPQSPPSEADASTDIWILDPIGDGDWRHIGVRVQRPGSYQIVSTSVTVGRVPDKADLVIPVATVSGVHARFEKRQGSLYVTDLDSTNGTYVNERRLNPGELFPVVPGSRVTFGDTHLAIFQVSKIKNVQVGGEAQEPEGEENAEEESSPDAQQTSS